MSRIWWATIGGLIIGAALLAMVQRGCSADAEIDAARRADAPALNGATASSPALRSTAPEPVTIAPTTPNLGRYQRQAPNSPSERRQIVDSTPPDPQVPSVEPGKTREEIRQEAIERRERYQKQVEESRRERERRQEESRRLALELAQRSGRLSPSGAARVRETPVIANNQDAEEARRRFRQQVTNPAARGSNNGDRSGSGATAGTGAAPGEGEGADSGSDLDSILDSLPDDARQALENLGGIPDGAQGSRGGADSLQEQRADTRFGGGDFPSLEELTPVAVWEPVARGETPDGIGVASADLFLGFVIEPSNPVISSRAENGLTARGGTFFSGRAIVQEALSPRLSATISTEAPSPLRSVVALGGAQTFFTPGSVEDPSLWGQTITAEWSSTDLGGITFIQDPDRFGDDRFYLRVGRFAVTESAYAVGGRLGVTWIDLASFSPVQVDVDVPECPDCWIADPPEQGGQTPGEGESPGGDGEEPSFGIASVSISPTTITAGEVAQGSVTLRNPAPAGGATITILIDDLGALEPSATTITIEEGERQAAFSLAAREVVEPAVVDVAFFLEGAEQTLVRRVTVVPLSAILPELDRITIVPQQILGGLTAQGRLRLVEPAPDGGVIIDLISSASTAIVPETVSIPAGAASVVFDVQTLEVAADAAVMITAQLGSQRRAADLVLKAEVFGDVNRDGVVDGFDLAALLAATVGEYDENADLDNDGDVDLDDLAVLVDLLESAGGVGQNPAADAPVIAKWVPVSRDECQELEGYRSADLFLGYLEIPSLAAVASAPGIGLTVEGGEFYQHPLGDNAPPNPALFEFAPCLRYDSFLTIGDTRPFFTPTFPQPSPGDWGQTLVAEWFPTPGAQILTVQDPERFGDDRFYVRIARITVPVGTRSLTGRLETITITDGGPPVDRDVTVYHCSSCWGQYDLNSDGVVSDLDLEIMISLLGEEDPAADLNGSGAVDLDDLRLLIAAIGS